MKQNKFILKGIFDFLLSLLIIFILSPLIIVLIILIKIDSPGPIFYISDRYGYECKKFKMFKFRSMEVDAESKLQSLMHMNEVDGPIFKIKKDPRITRFGKFLRKYSLDEIPQLINVIKGDMSLIGPRPLPNDIDMNDKRQVKRLCMKPGMTGLWQIKGRSDTSFYDMLRWDIWYVNNWSFSLDIFILIRTIPVVIKGRGAY